MYISIHLAINQSQLSLKILETVDTSTRSLLEVSQVLKVSQKVSKKLSQKSLKICQIKSFISLLKFSRNSFKSFERFSKGLSKGLSKDLSKGLSKGLSKALKKVSKNLSNQVCWKSLESLEYLKNHKSLGSLWKSFSRVSRNSKVSKKVSQKVSKNLSKAS